MPRKQTWTDAEIEILSSLYARGCTSREIADSLPGRTVPAIDSKLRGLALRRVGESDQYKTLQETPLSDAEARSKDVESLLSRIAALEAENGGLRAELGRLREQKTWSDHAAPTETTGGTLTIARSDDHIGDAAHLLHSCAELESKVVEIVRVYQPDSIQILHLGDMVAGDGIYKNQDLDAVTTSATDQVLLGAWKMRRWLQAIRAVSAAPITWRQIKGNHEVAGKLDLGPVLVLQLIACFADIENVAVKREGARCLANLAAQGDYWAYATHGFGYSGTSPNSPAFVAAVKDSLLQIFRQVPNERHPRRVISGHTHWLDTETSRGIGIEFDTCGGLQRNERVKLGMNNRPPGWICYVSTEDLTSDILRPIPISVSEPLLLRELEDAFLREANYADAAATLAEARQWERESGIDGDSIPGLPKDGRW